MEFLDIDLNTWSIIIFFVQAIFYVSMTLSVFAGIGNKILLAFTAISFIINQIVFLTYGIVTEQIGFVLIVAFQFFLTLLTFIFISSSAEKEILYEDN